MKVKLILGEYAYLYHGNLDLQDINNFIKTLTQYSVIIKWKDLDDEMIRILRPQDLKYCVDITSKQKQTLRLYLQECLPSFQQFNQKQFQYQQNQQSMLQSNCQQIQASNQSVIENPILKKEMTFAQDSSQPFLDSYEKQKYFQQIALTVIQEVYPGLQIDFDDINEKKKIVQMNEISQHYEQIEQKPLRKIESRQNTEKMTPQFYEKRQDENYVPENENYSMINQNKQSLNLKLEENSNSDTVHSSRQNENFGDIYFCDYCSEQIEVEFGYKCENKECLDLHFCQTCVDKLKKEIHEHELVKLEKGN
ncbi:unnamed protein product (macronuclear) [Paramecium tetraurelia]|uniref:ZZ-type domain-containing protein n=1 Tax=Paramecium tetraurelia TaxID=5888 RepID=A0D8E4_PARTE|nr:uncharacterized protein GSPATT00039329001 [Paramecium tetraurelia]CAK79311.1 unnamed protein product [Paramecium tetraurelia]|eukprot:XP_001446708.1 hypothetical protein (macronuclear) [Paramecium tetraurelia strain d4-2]